MPLNTKKIISLLLLLVSFALAASAQLLPSKPATPTKAADPLNRETPSGTVLGFLEAAQSGNYSIAAQYLQLSNARRQSDGETLAQQLKLVMDRALAGSLKNVSGDPDGRPEEGVSADRQRLGMMSSGDVEAELILARVSDPAAGKIWLISSETLSKVPELYDQVEARQVETRLPKWVVKHQFAGMALWQWFALLLLIPLAAGAAWLVMVVLQIPLRWWAGRHGHPDIAHMRSVSGPAWLLVGTLIHRILASYIGMPLLQRHYYSQVTAVAVIVGTNWILWRIVRWFLQRVRNQAMARGRGGTGSLMLLGRAHDQSCHLRDDPVFHLRGSRLQSDYRTRRRRHRDSGHRFRRPADDREFVWRRPPCWAMKLSVWVMFASSATALEWWKISACALLACVPRNELCWLSPMEQSLLSMSKISAEQGKNPFQDHARAAHRYFARTPPICYPANQNSPERRAQDRNFKRPRTSR